MLVAVRRHQVGSVERLREHGRARDAQHGGDVHPHALGRGGGERDEGHAREIVLEHGEVDVIGAEIVTPLPKMENGGWRRFIIRLEGSGARKGKGGRGR